MTHRRTLILGTLAAALIAAGAVAIHAQAPPPQAPPAQQQGPAGAPSPNQLAEQRFKNIQLLKGVPADQIIPTMQFIAASLGVECEYCHVEHAFDKDDKKEKRTAREMITMMMAINKDNFKGEREVTCYSCHRGATHPVGTPILTLDLITPAAPPPPVSANATLPTADAILAKYLDAVGGKAALEKIQTREQTGTITVGAQPGHDPEHSEDVRFPITIYSEAPNKRISKTKMNGTESVTAYNGTVGWLSTPGGVRPMNAGEAQAASIDAQLHFASTLPQLYSDFRVRPGDAIDGRSTYMVAANDQLPLRLYFDQQTGLLLRLIRYAETPLGRLPTQIDYADYRKADDVTIPFRWTLARPSGRFTIQIDTVKQNSPIDEKLFIAPPPGPPPGSGPGGPGGPPHGPPPSH